VPDFTDLASGLAFDPQMLNRYSYCRNNPLIFSDPTGLALVLVGQGGYHGGMFTLAANTWARENPGVHQIVQVSSGEAAIQAMQAYAKDRGAIDSMQVFSHSSNRGIYFNQSASANSLYEGMPISAGSGARSVNQIKSSWFANNASVKLWGCNTAREDDPQPIAKTLANQIGLNVTGSTGPTAFSGSENGKPGQGLPSTVPADYTGPVHLVPQYSDQGFKTVSPERSWFDRFVDFFESIFSEG
jgi:hypothetical protein